MKAVLFWPILLVVVLLDFVTKSLAVSLLGGVPHTVIGETVRFVLVYNPGAAFGFYLGEYSRWIFMALTIGALVILSRLYQSTVPGDTVRTLAISFVSAGALGNLLDRIRTEHGVVDFIDIGFGTHRWPTFNIADIAVSGGAVLLAFVLWGEDKRAAAASAIPLPNASIKAAPGDSVNITAHSSVNAAATTAAVASSTAAATAAAVASSTAAPLASGDAGNPS